MVVRQCFDIPEDVSAPVDNGIKSKVSVKFCEPRYRCISVDRNKLLTLQVVGTMLHLKELPDEEGPISNK